MMMMFQKIIYRGQDLAKKVRKWQLRFLKKAYVEVKLWNHVMGWLLEKKRGDGWRWASMKCEKKKNY
jgi:hypothetical protein